MEYKQIYTEPVTEFKREGQRYEQFYRLTLYGAQGRASYEWPFLLKSEWGLCGDDDWRRSWEVMDMQGKGSAVAIREVIKRIDSHQYEPVTENSP